MLSSNQCAYGALVFLDPERVMASVGGHALRLTPDGDIEAYMMTPGATLGWVNVEELDLVQLASGGTKAKKN